MTEKTTNDNDLSFMTGCAKLLLDGMILGGLYFGVLTGYRGMSLKMDYHATQTTLMQEYLRREEPHLNKEALDRAHQYASKLTSHEQEQTNRLLALAVCAALSVGCGAYMRMKKT